MLPASVFTVFSVLGFLGFTHLLIADLLIKINVSLSQMRLLKLFYCIQIQW